jgi:hypothetical protein
MPGQAGSGVSEAIKALQEEHFPEEKENRGKCYTGIN